jgi:phage recombination protein Bet
VNAVATEVKDLVLPTPVARRGITEAQWRTAVNSLYPGAKPESICMVFDYCKARGLDPMKKPCHIVPMRVKHENDYLWRDVVMPGIYELRTTAMRTSLYMGHSPVAYGPPIEFAGVTAPEWCEATFYRWHAPSNTRTEFPVRTWLRECIGTTKKDGKTVANQRWATAPVQMMTKCNEAAGLREVAPDELGGVTAAEEVDTVIPTGTEPPLPENLERTNRFGMIETRDWEERDKHVAAITDIMNENGGDEDKIAELLRDYVTTYLQNLPDLWLSINDKLVADGIISKANLKKWLSLNLQGTR